MVNDDRTRVDERLSSTETALDSIDGQLGAVEDSLGTLEDSVADLRRSMRRWFVAVFIALTAVIILTELLM